MYTVDGRAPVPIGCLQRYAMDHAASPDLLPRARQLCDVVRSGDTSVNDAYEVFLSETAG